MIGKWLRRRFPWPPLGQVNLGALRWLTPAGSCPPGSLGALDRALVEEFLGRHAGDVGGRILEEGNGGFAALCGGARVAKAARFDADRGCADVPVEPTGYDCILLPSALGRVFDVRSLLRDLHRRLRPGGIMLAILPGAAQRLDGASYWRFTPYSARLLFGEVFGEQAVTLTTRGNVLIALAHAHRLPGSELGPGALRVDDPDYPFMIGVRAIRQAGT